MKPKVLLLMAALLLPMVVTAQTAEEQVGKEIARLKQMAAALPENDDVKGMRPVLTGALDRAEQSLKAGRMLHSFDLLTQITPRLLALQFREQPRFAGADIKKFEADWRATGNEFAADESRFKQSSWEKTPAAVRAMAEAAWSQVRVTYDAALPYAQNTSPATGYYYLGEARGALEWALFLRGLRFPKAEKTPEFRSVAPEITALEQKIGEAYKPPLSVDKHPQFIRLNATIKQAIELDSAGMHAGAGLYRYYVAIDEDVDPVDLKQVFWAISTRADPADSVQLLKSWTTDLDPRLPPEKRERNDFTMSRVLIDACKPFHWRDKFPMTNKFETAKRREIAAKWSGEIAELGRFK